MIIRFPPPVHMRRWCARAAMAMPLLLVPRTLLAHPGRAPEPHDLWTAWQADPVVIAGLALGVWLYLRGAGRIRARAGGRRGIPRWRTAAWLGGMAAVALALLSPIDAVGQSLFAVHMVQHLLLIMVAAPLLTLGEPLVPMLFALSPGVRRTVGLWWRDARVLPALWGAVTHPLGAWTLHVGGLVAWHIPRCYDAAARSLPVHVLEHLTFFVTALWFWWVLFDRRSRHRLGTGPAVLYLFTAALASTLLGAAISLSARPWYSAHWGTTTAWGLTPLEDQQVAGLIMWVPGGMVYLMALAPMMIRVLSDRRIRD
jgi:putative membrane protein